MTMKNARCQCALELLANSPGMGGRHVLASRSREASSKRSWRLKGVVRNRKIDMWLNENASLFTSVSL